MSTTYTLTNTTTATTSEPSTASLSLTPSNSPMPTTSSSSSPTTTTMEDILTQPRRLFSSLSTTLLPTIESNPLALMTLQYLTAATRAAAFFFLSAVWTLGQSLVWMVTAEGLDWIQSRDFGPLILEWDSFLLGAIFLTVDIHPDSIEFHHAKPCCGWMSPSHSRSSSRSSSINSSGRRVTFDEKVKVLGRSGAVQQQQQRGITPILVNNSYNYSYNQDPYAAPIMTESPTRSTFSSGSSPSSLSQEAEFLQRNYGYSNNYQYQHQYIDSPSSSRSNSCSSSICSVSSSESVESATSSSSASASAKPTASTKSNSSSRLVALFHHNTSRHTSTNPHSPPTSSPIDSTQPSGTKSKNLVHRIMHPHQHKRELEQLIQQQQQQPQPRHDPQPYHIPEFLDVMTMSSSSVMEHEYQPSEHTRKTLKQRFGLKKKSHST